MNKDNILIDLRIDRDKKYNEFREQIDIGWFKVLKSLKYRPLLISAYSFNNEKQLEQYVDINKIKIIILSGGGNIYSKKSTEENRLVLSRMLIKVALKKKIPLIGICRGAQALLKFYKIRSSKNKYRIKQKLRLILKRNIKILPKKILVTCYHNNSVKSSKLKKFFDNVYEATDKTSEVFINKYRKQIGIMWHPERENKNMLFKKIIEYLK